jgi:hypothetical protein
LLNHLNNLETDDIIHAICPPTADCVAFRRQLISLSEADNPLAANPRSGSY